MAEKEPITPELIGDLRNSARSMDNAAEAIAGNPRHFWPKAYQYYTEVIDIISRVGLAALDKASAKDPATTDSLDTVISRTPYMLSMMNRMIETGKPIQSKRYFLCSLDALDLLGNSLDDEPIISTKQTLGQHLFRLMNIDDIRANEGLKEFTEETIGSSPEKLAYITVWMYRNIRNYTNIKPPERRYWRTADHCYMFAHEVLTKRGKQFKKEGRLYAWQRLADYFFPTRIAMLRIDYNQGLFEQVAASARNYAKRGINVDRYVHKLERIAQKK